MARSSIETIAMRRAQLVKCAEAVAQLAEHRAIVPMLAGHVIHDVEIRRVLETVVRRWSKLESARYASVAAAATTNPKDIDLDHVVPCRVLVDHMIMHPDQCQDILERGVLLARITKVEHRALGGIFTHHEDVSGEMLRVETAQLAELGRKRYALPGIELRPFP